MSEAAQRKYSKKQVNHAGEILANPNSFGDGEQLWANFVMATCGSCRYFGVNIIVHQALRGATANARIRPVQYVGE